MDPDGIFCHGAAVCGVEHGSRADVQRHGGRQGAYHVLDIAHIAAMDIQVPLESVP